MFVAMGLSAVVPVIHGLQLYTLTQMEQLIGLRWLLLQGFLYILGATIYAVRASILRRQHTLMCNAGQSPRTIPAWSLRSIRQLSPDLPHPGGLGGHVSS